MEHQKDGIHDLVKEKYSAIAQGKRDLGASSCCGGPTPLVDIQALSKTLDYGDEDLLLAPCEANLGQGVRESHRHGRFKAGRGCVGSWERRRV